MSAEDINIITQRLDRIERLALLQIKPVLTIEEASIFTGLSLDRIRHLALDRKIPHYKQGRRLYFRKAELEDWLTSERRASQAEIERHAAAYVSSHNNA